MKNKKNNTSNLVFSAFLVIAFVICAYFFSGIVTTSTGMNDTVKTLLMALIFVVFGLFLFYATRVGDGKQVKRFSLATLIIMDIPALYIIIASAAQGLPFSSQIASCPTIIYLAAVTLGYGIPYTFLSGYEQQPYDEKTDNEDNTTENDETDEFDGIKDIDENAEINDDNNGSDEEN
ncbi:MAG: hypothetical protein PUG48_07690 [Clostridia bacterium]|nr:hypothetical protein [Clostridia bacterium]